MPPKTEPTAEELAKAALEKLRRSRGAHLGHARRHAEKCDVILTTVIAQVSEDQVSQLKSLRFRLAEKIKDIEAKNSALEDATEYEELDEEIDKACEIVDELNAKLMKVDDFLEKIAALKTSQQQQRSSSGSPPSQPPQTPQQADELKLPRIELPTFSGKYSEWISFAEMFKAAVDDKRRLSDSEKMHYLRSALRDDALKIISGLSLSGTNYPAAWKLLEERYENKRAIVRSHVQAIFHAPKIRNDGDARTLRRLVETVQENNMALKSLNVNTGDWDAMLVYMVTEKLDEKLRRDWELHVPGTGLQTYKQLMDFLAARAAALEASSNQRDAQKPNPTHPKPKPTTSTYSSTQNDCPKCTGDHRLHRCKDFAKLDVDAKTSFIQKKGLCFNCLQSGHQSKNCPSNYSCRQCSSRHHTLLHKERRENDARDDSNASQKNNHASVSALGNISRTQSVLPTIQVPILDKNGHRQNCRALLDCGSQINLMREEFAKKLRLRWTRTNSQVSGIGKSACSTAGKELKFRIQTPNRTTLDGTALVLTQLTNPLPSFPIQQNCFRSLSDLELADPNFGEPNSVDMILGVDMYNKIVTGKPKRTKDAFFLQETLFGWIVSGTITANPSKTLACNVVHHDILLQRFWELEDLPSAKKYSPEEADCERHFNETTIRKQDGRYSVCLPFKRDSKPLGNSLRQAEKRFQWVEQKLDKTPEIKTQYINFINETLHMNHMEEVPLSDLYKPNHDVCYLPHHHVVKESTTTKLRVVFDGSAKTEHGPSLNDTLMVGPKIQDDLFHILLRFRLHRIALSADVEKMYRQVELQDDHRDFHRIVWREDNTKPLRHLRMTRVIYGIASSAFHSVRVLHEIGNNTNNELIKRTIHRDFYVDDLLSGADTIGEASQLQDNLINELGKSGFPLRKWTSSSVELVTRLDDSLREANESVFLQDPNFSIKALGVKWYPAADEFAFQVRPLDTAIHTKRGLLSDTARIYDPMGWFSPVTVVLKCFLQRCWILGLDWDDRLPETLLNEWTSWRSNFDCIANFRLPRCILPPLKPVSMQLHVFSDASEIAYGAAIYIRCSDEDNNVTCNLLAAKTKVAPVKAVTLPRLELCAAHLGTKLLSSIEKSFEGFDFPVTDIFAWTDSTVVLSWLSELPRTWKTFVANRVSDIQERLPPQHWRHVPSDENPADVASRGSTPWKLLDSTLWWNGPAWLLNEETNWPHKQIESKSKDELPEKRKIQTIVSTTQQNEFPINMQHYSSYVKLTRVTAWCLRFIQRLKRPKPNTPRTSASKTLEPDEILRAETVIWKQVQTEMFSKELRERNRIGQFSAKSQLLSLSPFINSSGLICVGGRLKNSDLPKSTRHPILLRGNHHVVKLLVKNAHLETLHGGQQLTHAKIREQYWIIRGRDVVRRIVGSCVRCFRFNPKTTTPMMSDLPASRVTPSRPFTNTGLDFAGPFTIRLSQLRNAKQDKAYLALFVCFATKCVHLEVVSSLTTAACIAAIRRFVSRRGLPEAIHSDNGTNLVGSKNELRDIYNFLQADDNFKAMSDFCTNRKVKWSTIPPRSPHFGGLWEAGIKSAKHHLRRIVGSTPLTFEELSTAFTQIEAMLNSRPLCQLSEDPNDAQALTPGHFLIGAPLNSWPDVGSQSKCVGSRWKLVQTMMQHFWQKWKNEYVTGLQQRQKWSKCESNLKVNDLVLIREDNVPNMMWPLARILALHPGDDGIVRVCTLKTAAGTTTRPSVRLHRLPLHNSDELTQWSQGGRDVAEEEKDSDCVVPEGTFLEKLTPSKSKVGVSPPGQEDHSDRNPGHPEDHQAENQKTYAQLFVSEALQDASSSSTPDIPQP